MQFIYIIYKNCTVGWQYKAPFYITNHNAFRKIIHSIIEKYDGTSYKNYKIYFSNKFSTIYRNTNFNLLISITDLQIYFKYMDKELFNNFKNYWIKNQLKNPKEYIYYLFKLTLEDFTFENLNKLFLVKHILD